MKASPVSIRCFFLAAQFMLASLLAGCGGDWRAWPLEDDADSSAAVNHVIVFGDSLSDIGTYAAATGGVNGKFTINPGPVWIERIAVTAGRQISPNIVGYGPDSSQWLICPRSACFGYAQGGARVTAPNGVGNEDGTQSAAITVPVVTQIANHLAANNDRFAANDLVFIFAGSNDVFFQQALYLRALAANPLRPSSVARTAAEAEVSLAARQLVDDTRRQIVAKGARRVVLMTLPSSAQTPLGQLLNTTENRAVLESLTDAFNAALRQAVTDNALDVLVYDANAWFTQVVQNPAAYGISNVTDVACDRAKIATASAGAELGGSALFCTRDTLTAAALRDDRYAFADVVHPTPLVHELFADALTVVLRERSWLPR